MDNYFKKAEEYFDNDNYKKAIEYCDKSIKKGLYLKNAYCLKAHCECYISKGKDDKILENALKDINLAIENDNSDDWLFFIKALVFERMKKYEDALVEINKAIHLKKYYFYYDTRGILNKSLNRNKEALGDYTLSIETEENTDNYNNRGELYFDMGEYSLARADLQRAVELDDKNTDAWKNLGKALHFLDLFEQSISAFDAAIQLEPDDDFIYYLKSRPQKSLNKYKEALISINKAIEMDSEYPSYYRQRGNLYFDWTEENTNSENTDLEKAFSFYANQKKSEKRVLLAEKDFKKAIELDDENILNYWSLLKVYKYRKDYKKQIEVFDKLEKLTPNDETIYSERGLAKMKLGEYETAIVDFTKFLEFEDISDNDLAAAYGNRGVCYTQLEKDEEALSDLDITVEMCPSAQAFVNRGVAKSFGMSQDVAIEDYKKALELEPDFPDAYFNTGISQYKQNLFEKAIENYCTAYDIKIKKQQKPNIENYTERFYDSLKGLFEQKKYKKIISFCNKIIGLGIKHEKIYNLKGAAEIMLGKFNEALRDCRKANKINPDFEPAKINLGIIKQNLKKME